MNKKKIKELAQEQNLEVLSFNPVLFGIKVKDKKGEDKVVAMSHDPARIVLEEYEETKEEYRYRQKMSKVVERNLRNTVFWPSKELGTYRKQSEMDVYKKYAELAEQDKLAEALMEMDKKLQEQKIEEK